MRVFHLIWLTHAHTVAAMLSGFAQHGVQQVHLGGAAAGDCQLLDVLERGVQVRLVLGARLPALILCLQVLPCMQFCCKFSKV